MNWMNIFDQHSYDCPNPWSSYRQRIIVMRLDIGKLEEFPTNHIPGFLERIKVLIPSLHEHECSEKRPGGFFERVRLGTWMGHVVEHIALEIQSIAGMDCGYGRTRSSDKPGVYDVVFEYKNKDAGIFAGKAAVDIAEALVNGQYVDIGGIIGHLKMIKGRTTNTVKEKSFGI
jgi:cyanophycin synthetase